MKTTIILSALLGLGWGALAVMLMGEDSTMLMRPSTWTASLAAGAGAGWHTVGNRRRRHGKESLVHGLANYYAAMCVFWLVLMSGWQVEMAWENGWRGLLDVFDWQDRLGMLVVILVYGTVPYGMALIPLAFASRQLVWAVHQRAIEV